MASTFKCPYCGADVHSDERNCPGCGAPNELYVTAAPAPDSLRPKTMEELLDFAAERHMPLERMRFFVGKDYREPRAFGVYRDADGNYIVYKNKANGERAIRYSGPDEARAVGELYDKLLSECHNRHISPEDVHSHGSHSSRTIHYDLSSRGSSSSRGRQSSSKPKIAIVVFVLLFLLFFSKGCGLSLSGSSDSDYGYYDTDYGYYDTDEDYNSDYGYYDSDDSYSSSDDDDDDWDDWDDSDSDWDSDW